jgi:hypothetical protein
VSEQQPPKRRTVAELRRSIDANREQIDEDLATLGDRVDVGVHSVRRLGRHPVVIVAAGAVMGFLVFKKPTMLLRAAGRIARWGAPLVLSGLLRPSSAGEGIAAPDDATDPTPPAES